MLTFNRVMIRSLKISKSLKLREATYQKGRSSNSLRTSNRRNSVISKAIFMFMGEVSSIHKVPSFACKPQVNSDGPSSGLQSGSKPFKLCNALDGLTGSLCCASWVMLLYCRCSISKIEILIINIIRRSTLLVMDSLSYFQWNRGLKQPQWGLSSINMPTSEILGTLLTSLSYFQGKLNDFHNNRVIDFLRFNLRLKGLRVLRVVRPLRSVKAIPSMRRLVSTLLRSLPELGSAGIFIAFMLFLFTILGLQQFSGIIYNKCRVTPEPIRNGTYWPKSTIY